MDTIVLNAGICGEIKTAEFCQAIDRVKAGTAELYVYFPIMKQNDAFYKKAKQNFPTLLVGTSGGDDKFATFFREDPGYRCRDCEDTGCEECRGPRRRRR